MHPAPPVPHREPEASSMSGFLRFWTTLPGVLTAAAAVITAVGGIFIASAGAGSGDAHTNPPVQPPLTQSVSTSFPPTLVGQESSSGSLTIDEVTNALIACDSGDLGACTRVAQFAEIECDQGILDSCLILEEMRALGIA